MTSFNPGQGGHVGEHNYIRTQLEGRLSESELAATMGGIVTERAFSYDVRLYGAVCDGSTDDASAVNAAISAAYTAGGGVVQVPGGTTAVASPVTVKNRVRLVGVGRGATRLQAKVGFTGDYLVRIGDGSEIAFGTTIERMTVDANNAVDVAVFSDDCQELCGVFHSTLTKFTDIGLSVNNDRVGSTPRFVTAHDLEVYGSGDGWTYGIRLVGMAGPVVVDKVTINGNDAEVGTAGILVESTTVTISAVHGERVNDTVVMGANATGVIMNVDGTTDVSGHAVRIAAASSGRITVYGADGVNDQQSSLSTTDFVPFYALDGYGSGSAKGRLTNNRSISNRFSNEQEYAARRRNIRTNLGTLTGNTTLDLAGSADFVTLTLGASLSLSFSNLADGQELTLMVINGAGGYTLSWGGGVNRWSGGSAPVMSTTAGLYHVFRFLVMGGRLREMSRSVDQSS